MVELQLQSTVTCPECGHQRTETMPTAACQFFYECAGCGAVWADAWSATCDDECPRCGHGTSPSHSEEVAPCDCDYLGG